MRIFLGFLVLLIFGCVKEQPEPEFLIVPTQPSHMYRNDTPVHYFYNSSGDLIRKEWDTCQVEYIYDNYHKRNEVVEQSSDIRNFQYTSLGISSIDTYSFQYGTNSICQNIVNNDGLFYSDSIYVISSQDTVRLIRNSFFASTKYRTTHLFYRDLSTKEYCILRSNIEYYSESQRRYLSTLAAPEMVAKIFYTEKIPVKIKRPVQEDIVRLSEFVASGNGFSKISKIELLFLEELLPEKLPISVTSQHDLFQFEYTFSESYILERIDIKRTSLSIEDAPYNPILLKFHYPHE